MDIFGQRRGHYAITTVISKYCHYYKVLPATLPKAAQRVGSRAMSPDPPDLKALLLFTMLSSIRITQKVYESIGSWAHPEGFWFWFWCRAWECAFLTSSQMMLKLLVWVPCFENHCTTTCCPPSLPVFKQMLNDFLLQRWLKGGFNQTLSNVPSH